MKSKLLSFIEHYQQSGLEQLQMSVEEYLEDQARIYTNVSNRTDSTLIDEYENFILEENPISPFQSKVLLFSLRNKFLGISRALEKSGEKLTEKPLLATSLTGKLSGLTLYHPKEGYSVIVDESVFTTSIILSKIMSMIIFSGERSGDSLVIIDDEAEVASRIKAAPLAQDSFNDSIASFIKSGSPVFAPHIALPSSQSELSMVSILSDGMTNFFVGHELGHIYGGHFEDQEYAVLTQSNDLKGYHNGSSLPIYKAKNMLEHWADWYGFLACMETGNKIEAPFKLYGAFSFLYFNELLSHALLLWHRGKDDYNTLIPSPLDVALVSIDTHPPSNIRAQLLPVLSQESMLGENMKTSISGVHKSAKAYMKCLWNNFLQTIDQDTIDRIIVSPVHHKKMSDLDKTIIYPSSGELSSEQIQAILGFTKG